MVELYREESVPAGLFKDYSIKMKVGEMKMKCDSFLRPSLALVVPKASILTLPSLLIFTQGTGMFSQIVP